MRRSSRSRCDAALAAACSAAVQASRPECAKFSTPRPLFLLAFLRRVRNFPHGHYGWFSRRPDHFGALAVADLRLRGLDSAAILPTAATPVRGPARRPCAAGRARRRGRAPAARPRLPSMSSASIRRRRSPKLSAAKMVTTNKCLARITSPETGSEGLRDISLKVMWEKKQAPSSRHRRVKRLSSIPLC